MSVSLRRTEDKSPVVHPEDPVSTGFDGDYCVNCGRDVRFVMGSYEDIVCRTTCDANMDGPHVVERRLPEEFWA